MVKLLFTWELGANHGHLARLIPIAEVQRSLGREVLFAVCNLAIAEKLLTPLGFAFVAAPQLKGHAKQGVSANYTELLLAVGYEDRNNLSLVVKEWLRLYSEYAPDLIVVDHSPTALLANYVSGHPVIQIGSGFEMPPSGDWSTIFPFSEKEPIGLTSTKESLLSSMNYALAASGGVPMQDATDLFKNCKQLLASFEELDHYPDRKSGCYIGPIYKIDHGPQVIWPGCYPGKIFVYAWPALPGLNLLMTALANMEVDVIAVIPGIAQEATALFNRPNIVVLDKAARFDGLFKQCSLLITHSGFGTVNAFLRHGVPTLIVPSNLEQLLVGGRVVSLAAGLVMGPKRNLTNFTTCIAQLLENPKFTESAKRFARRHEGWHPDVAISYTTRIIDKLLAKPETNVQYSS